MKGGSMKKPVFVLVFLAATALLFSGCCDIRAFLMPEKTGACEPGGGCVFPEKCAPCEERGGCLFPTKCPPPPPPPPKKDRN